MGEKRNGCKILIGKREGTILLSLHVDGRIILKRILRKQDVSMWTGFIWLRAGSSDEFL
jgi:hypothetical protein